MECKIVHYFGFRRQNKKKSNLFLTVTVITNKVFLTRLVVVKRIVNGDVTLDGDCDRHENGCRHHDGLAGEEEVREEDDMNGGRQLEAFPEALEDGAEEVARVEHGQRDQHQVEGVPHVFGSLESMLPFYNNCIK